MKKIAFGLIALLALTGVSSAATKTSDANGLWSTAAGWNADGVPAATDDVVVDGESKILDAAADCADMSVACGRTLTISAGASVTMGRGATHLWIDCSATTNPCISILGTLIIGPGQTLVVGSNQGGASNPDRINVGAGGRLIVNGRVLAEGSISSVPTDEATVTNPLLAFGLPTQDFEFQDANARFPLTSAGAQEWVNSDDCIENCYVVRFTSGDRRWRWYNTLSPSGAKNTNVLVDFDSRSNPAQSSSGTGVAANTTAKANGFGAAYTTGTACLSATSGGACADSGQWVTGSGTSWSNSFALGSRFFCTATGAATAVRIDRVDSTTSIHLNQSVTAAAGECDSGGADAYTIVDDNQPWPFWDHSEHIRPGDRYQIVQPATIRAGVITTGAEPTGATGSQHANIQCASGAICEFNYASIRWMGHDTFSSATDAGVYCAGDDACRFTNTEFKGTTNSFFILMLDQQGTEFSGNFVHYAGSVTPQGAGHGLTLDTNTFPPTAQVGNIIKNNRFELLGDDGVWVRAPNRSITFSGNVCKYFGAHILSESANCVDFLGRVGADANPTTGTEYFSGNVTDNLASNFGSLTTVSDEIVTGAGTSAFGWRYQASARGAGYKVNLGFTRNQATNIQNGSGFGMEHMDTDTPTTADSIANTVTVAGNFVGYTAMDGIAGATNTYNNAVIAVGLDRDNDNTDDGYAGIRFGTKNVKGNIVIPVDEAITSGPWVSTEPIRHALKQDSALINATDAQIGYASDVQITDNWLFGHIGGARIGTGGTSCPAITGAPMFTFDHNYISCELARGTPSFYQVGLDICVAGTTNYVTATRNVISGCSIAAMRVVNIDADDPAPVESNNLLINTPVTCSGATPAFNCDASDILSTNLGWSPLAFDFSRIGDLSADYGPRYGGVFWLPAWRDRYVFGIQGTTVSGAIDSDSDGILDQYDNCDSTFNPTQVDADSDGKGCACDASGEACI